MFITERKCKRFWGCLFGRYVSMIATKTSNENHEYCLWFLATAS